MAEKSIQIQVIASGDNGDTAMNFRMSTGTEFSKMMDAWCTHHGAPSGKVKFLLAGRELGRQDTPQSAFGPGLGLFLLPCWQLGNGPPPQIRAVPKRRAPALAAPKQRASRPDGGAAPALLRGGAPPTQLEEGLLRLRPLQRAPPPPPEDDAVSISASEDTESPSSDVSNGAPRSPVLLKQQQRQGVTPGIDTDAIDRKSDVRFRVVAKTVEECDNTMSFSMARDTPMGRLMMAWCNAQRLGPDAALFRIGDHELTVIDTPMSLAVNSVISEHLVGFTPGPRFRSDLDQSLKAEEVEEGLIVAFWALRAECISHECSDKEHSKCAEARSFILVRSLENAYPDGSVGQERTARHLFEALDRGAGVVAIEQVCRRWPGSRPQSPELLRLLLRLASSSPSEDLSSGRQAESLAWPQFRAAMRLWRSLPGPDHMPSSLRSYMMRSVAEASTGLVMALAAAEATCFVCASAGDASVGEAWTQLAAVGGVGCILALLPLDSSSMQPQLLQEWDEGHPAIVNL
ncbi:unnamed protein product, partial [Polarella glacialis]